MAAGRSPAAQPKLVTRPVTTARWPDFERLFEARGAPSYCWCMAWRATADEIRRSKTHGARKAMLKQRVEARVPIGLLGYIAGEPVAWVSVAPRPTLRALHADTDEDPKVWAVVCFFVRREHRGEGLTRALLDAAVRYAKKRGAQRVEGTPVAPDSPSYRFMGFTALFQQAGFQETGRAGSRRHVFALKLVS